MTIRLTSLDQLDRYIDLTAPPPGPAEPPADMGNPGPLTLPDVPDLQRLLAEIAEASREFGELQARDGEARATAAQLLDQHDAALQFLQDAERAQEQALAVRAQAEQTRETGEPTLKRQIAALESGGPKSAEYPQLNRRGHVMGSVLMLVVLAIVLLTVEKPGS